MKIIVVANPKGGVGKSTVATHIAGYLAQQGHAVMLGDADDQQSSRFWLTQRPSTVPAIASWEFHGDKVLRAKPPAGTTHVVIDTPAGISGWRLNELVEQADKIVVPLQPSVFDMQATHDFLLKLHQLTRGKRIPVGVIGNRVDTRTLSSVHLTDFLTRLEVPVLGTLRNTQYYLHLAAHGLSLFDISSERVQRDIEQWRPICKWLDRY